jgi:hypothetical protein
MNQEELNESSTCSADLFFALLCCVAGPEQTGTTGDGSIANMSSCDHIQLAIASTNFAVKQHISELY